MEECGFPLEDWFVELDAGFKSGILFTNWREQWSALTRAPEGQAQGAPVKKFKIISRPKLKE
jgi:hypothetical protein